MTPVAMAAVAGYGAGILIIGAWPLRPITYAYMQRATRSRRPRRALLATPAVTAPVVAAAAYVHEAPHPHAVETAAAATLAWLIVKLVRVNRTDGT